MFTKKQKRETTSRDYKKELLEENHSHQLELNDLTASHQLELKEKEFDLKHFKDDEVQKLKEKVSDGEMKIAVLEKENEMLGKITDLNGDVIDVKDLVTKLIDKLPEINISSLSMGNNNGDKS